MRQSPGWRERVYGLLEVEDSGPGRVVNALLMVLIAINVGAVILESVEPVYAAYRRSFDLFEAVSVAIFSLEYLGRLWSCVEARPDTPSWRSRLRYAFTPMALIDLLAILPFYLGMFIELDTRFLRTIRLLRVMKLGRHSAAMDLLLTVIRNEAITVASSLFILVIIIVVAASGMYIIEREAQPDAFQSIPQAMWWAAVTLTTVGYGDIVPVTTAGKVFGLFITIAGVGMVALPAGILASGFSQELQKRRAAYQLKVKESLADGDISRKELRTLRTRAAQLGLSPEEARLLLKTETSGSRTLTVCPHCGKPIHPE